MFLVNFAFTSASTKSSLISEEEGRNESAKIPSLYEIILNSVMEKLPVTSDYAAIQLVLELQVSVPLLPDGLNVLNFASKTRKVGLMRVVIDSGRFDVKAVDVDGFTALHHVCNGTENPEMAVDAAKLLVENGAYIDALDYRNHTPLHYAVEIYTDFRIVKALIESNPRLLDTVKDFLHFASHRRMIDLMRIGIDSE
jgi:ankyrin repeat protein